MYKKILFIRCLDKIVINIKNSDIPYFHQNYYYCLKKVFKHNINIKSQKIIRNVFMKSIYIYLEIEDSLLTDNYKWASINYIFKLENHLCILIHLLSNAKIYKLNINLTCNINEKLKIIFEKLGYLFNQRPIIQNNSINGVIYWYKQKLFYKTGSKENMKNEIIGYILLKNSYPVPLLKDIIIENNSFIMIFKYDNYLGSNKGLLADYLVSNINNDNIKIVDNIHNIFSFYRINLKNIVYRKKYPLQKFYKQRIFERIIPWYIENNKKSLDYRIVINNIKYQSTIAIITKIIKFFQIDKKHLCFLSQGDPTEVNLSLKPLFLDFDTAGYNPIICEIAIFFWNTYIAGGYFYPKYHPDAYKNHTKIIEKIFFNKPYLNYCINEYKKEIIIDFEYKIQTIRKKLLYLYFDVFKDCFSINDFNELKYYIVLRILGTLNITQMHEYDMILSMCFVNIFFKDYKNIKNILNGGLLMKKQRVRAIIPYNNGLILIKRIRQINNTEKQYYVFPGGGVETNENLDQAIIREVKEELGINIIPINQLYVLEEKESIQIFILCKYESGEIGTGNGPEFTLKEYENRGLYIPEIVNFNRIDKIDLLEEVKKVLIKDLNNNNILSKLETKFL